MNVTRAVLPHMRRRKSGCIINVTSVAGMIGLPCETGYCSAKFAVEGFTEALAWECKPLNVDVKSVAPGVYMKTSFGSNADNDDLLAGDEELVAHAKRLREHFLEAVKRSPTRSSSAPPRPLRCTIRSATMLSAS
jgi:short-subunit dehydrogenase